MTYQLILSEGPQNVTSITVPGETARLGETIIVENVRSGTVTSVTHKITPGLPSSVTYEVRFSDTIDLIR